MMILVSKIFFMSNQVSVHKNCGKFLTYILLYIIINPYLVQPGKLEPWIQLFVNLLDFDLGAEL